MARSLIAWGWGHLTLGDRRGVPLLGLEIIWLAALLAALPLLQTDRWIVVFGLVAGFLLCWVLQAVSAQRIAIERSGRSTGATVLVALVPLAIVIQTGFWLVGGSTASPAATLSRYVTAWETHHPENATALFATPIDGSSLSAAWVSDDRTVVGAVEAAALANPAFELDDRHPFSDLRFVYRDAAGGATDSSDSRDEVVLDIQIVRLATVPTSLFGLLPATRSETRTVATIGQAVLVRRPASAPSIAGASVWLIDRVALRG
jgi:hypothetical protein